MGSDRHADGAIAIVGTVVDDLILLPDGREVRGLGGLVYGVAAMAAALRGRRTMMPVCRVGHGVRERLEALWAGLPGVVLDGLVAHDGPPTRVELDYRAPGLAAGERLERLVDPLPPLDSGELRGVVDGAAAILVNMISGFDVAPRAFRELPRGRVVMLDVHSLSLARAADGIRTMRPVPDAAGWLAGADIVQCNLREAAMLTGTEATASIAQVADRLAALLRASGRPHTAILTLGTEGALLVPSRGEAIHRPAPRRVAGDPTGAGDTLGAAFLARLCLGSGPLEALDGAMEAAASACERSGVAPA